MSNNQTTAHNTLPRILLLYTKTGGGHLSAARAIKAAIDQRYPAAYDVVLYDVSASSHSRRVAMLYGTYNLMLTTNPRYTRQGMKLLNAVGAERAFIPWLPAPYRRMREALHEAHPDLMVSVHGIVNHVMLRALLESGRADTVPYAIVCTDLTNNFLKGWANPKADLIITFTEMARQQMLDYQVPAHKVQLINGFAVHPSFFQHPLLPSDCRAALGMRPDVFTILVSLGGMAIPGKTKAIVQRLCASGLPLQMMVVCGMNRNLKRQVRAIAHRYPTRVNVHGFTQRIDQMMTAADLMITKPGPGTMMEAVVKELPLCLDAVDEPMPQEKGNLLFAEKEEIAVTFTRYIDLPDIVDRLMREPETYHRLQANMRRIKNASAIFEVADALVALLPARTLLPRIAQNK